MRVQITLTRLNCLSPTHSTRSRSSARALRTTH
jgi:hypothetical protein